MLLLAMTGRKQFDVGRRLYPYWLQVLTVSHGYSIVHQLLLLEVVTKQNALRRHEMLQYPSTSMMPNSQYKVRIKRTMIILYDNTLHLPVEVKA